MNPPLPLISPATLHDWMQSSSPATLVIDTSFDLSDPAAGRRAYTQTHLPGAIHLDLEDDLSDTPNGQNGRHPLPDLDVLLAKLAQHGACDDSRIVVYDRQAAMFAARLWWLLRRAGHAQVYVLDGGLSAWQAEGLPMSTETPPARVPGVLTRRPALAEIIDYDTLRPLVDAGRAPLILDARAPDRFRGENETLDRIGGHIPGARNRFFRDNLDAGGRFLPVEVLRRDLMRALDGVAPADAVMQCGSGVTACHNLLALEAAGLSGARLYPGSWSEWSARPDAPVATGAD